MAARPLQGRDTIGTRSEGWEKIVSERPQFSIVIPTRNRAETLGPAIETCLSQDFEDFELLIVDNASSSATKELVESITDSRLKYIRRDEPLAMTHNWNSALSETSGQWICFIGDDDGLMPGALRTLSEITEATQARALRWDYVVYTWPDFPIAEMSSKLSVPTYYGDDRPCSGLDAVKAMAEAPDVGPRGPSIYHGLIKRSLIEEALATGPIFEGPIPDYFSGTLFAALCGEFLQLSRPASIAGLSGLSNGVAHITHGKTTQTRKDFESLNSSQGLTFHSELPDLNLTCVYILDAVFRVRDRLGLPFAELAKSSEDVADIAARTLWQSDEKLAAEAEELRRYTRAHGLVMGPEWDLLLDTPVGTRPPFLPNDGTEGFTGRDVLIDATKPGIHDVVGAGFAAASIYEAFSYCQPEFIDLRAKVPWLQGHVTERDQWIAQRDATIGKLKKRLAGAKADIAALRNSRTERVKRRLKRTVSR